MGVTFQTVDELFHTHHFYYVFHEMGRKSKVHQLRISVDEAVNFQICKTELLLILSGKNELTSQNPNPFSDLTNWLLAQGP